MPLFAYKALRADGGIAEGDVAAGGRPDAFRQMESLGLRPISLKERGATRSGNGAGNGRATKAAARATSTPAADSAASAPRGVPIKLPSMGKSRINSRVLENFTR